MALILTITDNADGTGCVATVVGSDTGSANAVYAGQFSGVLGGIAWFEVGSLIGDGTADVAIPVGYYLFYCAGIVDGDLAISSLIYAAITNGLDSIHFQALEAATARVQSLSLAGLSPANIVWKKLPLERIFKDTGCNLSMPGIVLCPQRRTADAGKGPNIWDDYVNPISVTILEADNQEPTLAANLGRRMKWLEQITRAFQNQRLPGVDRIITASVEPSDVVIPPAFGANLLASALILKFTSREPRGLT